MVASGKNVEIELQNPFEALRKRQCVLIGAPTRDKNRTVVDLESFVKEIIDEYGAMQGEAYDDGRT